MQTLFFYFALIAVARRGNVLRSRPSLKNVTHNVTMAIVGMDESILPLPFEMVFGDEF